MDESLPWSKVRPQFLQFFMSNAWIESIIHTRLQREHSIFVIFSILRLILHHTSPKCLETKNPLMGGAWLKWCDTVNHQYAVVTKKYTKSTSPKLELLKWLSQSINTDFYLSLMPYHRFSKTSRYSQRKQ